MLCSFNKGTKGPVWPQYTNYIIPQITLHHTALYLNLTGWPKADEISVTPLNE